MDLLALLLASLLDAQARQPGRYAPPAAVECARDHLTSYTGRVTAWSRTPDETRLVIDTDWDTRETVTLQHRGDGDARRFFLLDARPFTDADWARIERAAGVLHDGMRATAWVCDAGRQPIVDWQPPLQGQEWSLLVEPVRREHRVHAAVLAR